MRARRREGDRLTHTACRAQDRPCVMVETGETDECRGCDGVLSGATSELLCDTEQPSGFVPFAGERGTVATFSGDPSRCTWISSSHREPLCGVPVRRGGARVRVFERRRQLAQGARGPPARRRPPRVERRRDVTNRTVMSQQLARQAASEQRRTALFGAGGRRCREQLVVCRNCRRQIQSPQRVGGALQRIRPAGHRGRVHAYQSLSADL